MGWDFTKGATKQDIIQECCAGWSSAEHGSVTTLAKTVKGSHLWTIKERVKPDGTTERMIVLYLLAAQKDFGWGYKSMAAQEHPYYYTCPLSYLALVPCQGGEGEVAWRGIVQAQAAAKAEAVKATAACGDTVTLADGRRFEVRATLNGKIKQVMGQDGRVYRFAPRFMVGATVTPRASESFEHLPVH